MSNPYELSPEDLKLAQEIESMSIEEVEAELQAAGIDTSREAMRASAMRVLRRRFEGHAAFCGVSGIGFAVCLVSVNEDGEPEELFSATQVLSDDRAQASLVDLLKRVLEKLDGQKQAV